MSEVWDRVVGFYEMIKEKHLDDSVLLVSHGGPISSLLSYMHGEGLENIENYPIKNTAVSVVNVDCKKSFEFECYGCLKHLD